MNLADDLIQTAHSCDPAGGSDVHPSYSDDELHLGGCSLDEVAATFGTPLFVVHPAKLLERLAVFRRTFFLAGLHAEVFFSVKTNPLPFLLEVLRYAGAGAEVVSLEEYALARRAGFSPDRIVVNGPAKSVQLLEAAVRDDVALINVESLGELNLLRRVACRFDRRAHLGLRVNPAFRSWRLSPSRCTAAAGSAMGFEWNGAELETAIALLHREPNLCFRGLHMHLGSGIKDASTYVKAFRRVLCAAKRVRAAKLPLNVLDLGGGFGIAGAPALTAWDAVRTIAGAGNRTAGHAHEENALLSAVVQGCTTALRGFAARENIPLPTLYLEPGRSLCGPAQHLLMRVIRIAPLGNGAEVAFLERGAMSLSPLLLAERHAVLPIVRRSGAVRSYRLAGNLPTPLDLVAPSIELPEIREGDVLLIRDVGAYFTTGGNTFGGPRPAVAAVDKGLAWLIRRHETVDDLVARDVDALADRIPYTSTQRARAESSTLSQRYADVRP